MSSHCDTIHLYNTVTNPNVYQRQNENKSTKSLLVLKTPLSDVRRMCVSLLDHAQNALLFPLFALMTNFVCVCDAGRILPQSAEDEVQSGK